MFTFSDLSRYNSHDDAPLNKIYHFSVLNILCDSLFEIENKYSPQFQLIGECKY